jgi:hypothetical protein
MLVWPHSTSSTRRQPQRSGRARVPLRAEVVEVAAGHAAGIAAEIHPVEGGVVVATEACRQ